MHSSFQADSSFKSWLIENEVIKINLRSLLRICQKTIRGVVGNLNYKNLYQE